MASSDIQTNLTDVELGHSPEKKSLEQESASLPGRASQAGSGTFPTPDTGTFVSYAEYLDLIVEEWPEYKDLASYFRDRNVDSHPHHTAIRRGSHALVLQEIDDTLESHTFYSHKSWGLSDNTKGISDMCAYLEDVRTRAVVVFNGSPVLLDAIGLLCDVDPAFFHAAPKHRIYGYEADEIQISLSDSPKIFQLPGKMAAQALRYRNTAGQELSVGKFDASFKRSKKGD